MGGAEGWGKERRRLLERERNETAGRERERERENDGINEWEDSLLK